LEPPKFFAIIVENKEKMVVIAVVNSWVVLHWVLLVLKL
jgi:hypothetical protein